MERFKPKPEVPVSEALNQLRQAVNILREMGLEVIDRFITEDRLASEIPFPVVMDGLNGIRAEYSKRRGLEIWFTNGFEDPNDPRRLEIEKRFRENGLL